MTEYEFIYVGGTANSYLFRTSHDVFYEVKFKPTPYLFENHPDVANDVYEMVVETVQSPVAKVPANAYIPATIAAICKDYLRQKERILLYICDTSDRRQLARVRKFDSWFAEFKNHLFFKIDAQFPDVDGLTHYVSLILRWDHPFLHTVVSGFEELSRAYGPDK